MFENYTIVNCPSSSINGSCMSGKHSNYDCYKCDNCLLKKIFKLCEKDKTNKLSNDILGLFEIQEITDIT